MVYEYSECVGPTDSVAGTKTTVGAAFYAHPGAHHIRRIRVGKGNVVNAKECAGLITVEVAGVSGTFEYAYGGGVGGATNSHTGPAEIIECSIPVPGGSKITISVTDAEVAKNVTVSVEFHSGLGRKVCSYHVGGAGSDTAAATLLAVGNVEVTEKAGIIREIRFAGSGVVDADANSAILELKVSNKSAPHQFATGNGPSGATLGGPSHADVIGSITDPNIALHIPCGKEKIYFELTSAEILLSATISFQVV